MADRKPRRVIVTAAAAGLGLVIARSFRATGDNVAICDVDAAAVARFAAEQPQSLAMQVDMASEKAAGDFMRRAIERMGGVDILVNNAGIAGRPARWRPATRPRSNAACRSACSRSSGPCARRCR
jgi:NAD(P)-dependent dehydrogenase (short-subunit alcohol dehydrogenase family)